jgi:hypothetical protein
MGAFQMPNHKIPPELRRRPVNVRMHPLSKARLVSHAAENSQTLRSSLEQAIDLLPLRRQPATSRAPRPTMPPSGVS